MRAMKGTSREKLYQELGLQYLQKRIWMRRLCLFYKVASTKLAAYIYDFLPPVRQSQRLPNILNTFSCRTEYMKNSFFFSEWNKLNPEICSSGSYSRFRKSVLNFIRPGAIKVYNITNTIGMELITRLRLSFRHLLEHKFKHIV